MDPFVTQLASLARTQVTRNKWVVVPSHAVGRTIGERIVLEGTNWLNLRFVTPLDLALRMGAPFLVERGLEPSEEGLGPALIMRLLMALPKDGGYFRPLADQPTLAQALWTTIRELRMAGVRAADLTAAAFASPAKHAELQALLAAYERFLADTRRADMAAVYVEALAHPDWCPVHSTDCWTSLPDVAWSPLQQRLLALLPGERLVPRTLGLPAASVPRRLREQVVDRVQADASVHPLAWLLQPGGVGHEPRSVQSPASASASLPPGPGSPIPDPGHPILDPGAGGPDPGSPIPDPGLRIQPVALFHAGGREAEMEEVFRRILATGSPLDDIEIACASDAHVALAWEKALRHEWKVTLGPGIAATATRPGRALLALCDWIETDFSASVLRRMLQSGDLGLERDDEGFTAGEAARILARAEPGWGRETYRLSLTALGRSYESRAADRERPPEEREAAVDKGRQTTAVLEWLTRLLKAIPAPTAGVVPLQDVVAAAVEFVERNTARSNQLDIRAGAALADHLAELRGLGDFTCPLPQALRFVRERVETLQVAAERPRPGHLYVCSLTQAAWTGRSHLFVVGLEEGRVFPSASEDPVLLDDERAAISPALRLSSDRIDESVYGVLSRLAAWSATEPGPGTGDPGPGSPSAESKAANDAEVSRPPSADRRAPAVYPAPSAGRPGDGQEMVRPPYDAHRPPDPGPRIPPTLTLSYSCRDTREYRETYASWLMLQAFRLRQRDASLSYPQLKAWLGEPVSCVPQDRSQATTRGAWWLRSVVGTADAGRGSVEGSFALVARGRAAEAARASESFTAWDGLVPAAGAALDPCGAGRTFSVTELEGAAECPFRFFLKRGLGIRPVDARERDRDVWLDPLTRGSELHDLYAALWRRCRDAGRRPSVKADRAWLATLTDARLVQLNLEMPAATSEVYERERKDFLADVELFLDGECEGERATPVALEVSFGRSFAEDGEPESLARPDPVEIALGGGLAFRVAGRIDRIDQIGPSEFEVLDYKTGGYWRESWKGTFNGGRRLQHALYGLAAVELLRARHRKPTVSAGVYYFSSHKGRQQRRTIPAPSAATLTRVLGDLRDVIRAGAFVHAPDDDNCKWCDYARACGPRAHAQAEGKLADGPLEAYRRLTSHE